MFFRCHHQNHVDSRDLSCIFSENAVSSSCTGVVEIPKTSLLCREIGRRRGAAAAALLYGASLGRVGG